MSQKSIEIKEVKFDVVRVCTLGNALAMTISWSLHQHIGWAALHGFFGWTYVLFYWLTLQ